MASLASQIQKDNGLQDFSLRAQVECLVDELISSLPNPETLPADQQRGIIARYTAVLEGNFIYWMTATLLSVKSEEAQSIIVENLSEEVRDCHPGMMRRFALAADAAPSASDAMAVYRDLTNVRVYLGRLAAVPNLVAMAFFEGFIQKFMAYLADLARRQGSSDMEYTDVHGVCDVTHTNELYRALSAEMGLNPPDADTNIFEGVELLRNLLITVLNLKPRAASDFVAAHVN